MSYDQFGLNQAAMLNDPRSGFDPWIILKMDGSSICAHLNNFTDLQESPSGFGETSKEAVVNLLKDMKMHCHRAMWSGYGAPAGTCNEPAYSNEIHPNCISGMLVRECARCPKHGGFDMEASAALALFYRTPNRAEFS